MTDIDGQLRELQSKLDECVAELSAIESRQAVLAALPDHELRRAAVRREVRDLRRRSTTIARRTDSLMAAGERLRARAIASAISN